MQDCSEAVEYQKYSYSHEYDDATFKSIMRHRRRCERRGLPVTSVSSADIRNCEEFWDDE